MRLQDAKVAGELAAQKVDLDKIIALVTAAQKYGAVIDGFYVRFPVLDANAEVNGAPISGTRHNLIAATVDGELALNAIAFVLKAYNEKVAAVDSALEAI